jgi:hypothetical protein
LSRSYVKDRDWYDFIWYTARKTAVNYQYLEKALQQSGPWKNTDIHVDQNWLYSKLYERITSIDWKEAAMDVKRFIPVREQASLEYWNTQVFLQQLDKLHKIHESGVADAIGFSQFIYFIYFLHVDGRPQWGRKSLAKCILALL